MRFRKFPEGQRKIIKFKKRNSDSVGEFRPVGSHSMRKIGWDFVGYSNRVCFLSLLFSIFLLKLISSKPLADKVLDYRPDSETSNSYFPADIAEAIHQLWKDPKITKIMDEHSSDFYLAVTWFMSPMGMQWCP
jgi:hypothetical protein